MGAEVEKSRAAAEALQQSTASVDKTSSIFSTYQGILRQSGKIVSRIRFRELLDRFIIYGALLFFCAVVLRIVWRRFWIPFYDRRASTPPPMTYEEEESMYAEFHDEF